MNMVALGDLCTIRSGGTPSRSKPEYYGGDIPWAKISDIEASDGVLTDTEERITGEGLAAIRGREFRSGTLLFAIYGSIGKMAFAGRTLTTNQAILGIENTNPEKLSDRYLFRYLESRRDALINDGAGIAQKNLSAGYVRDIQIPLPPLSEQKRIAGVLDQAARLCRLRARAIETLNTLGQAIFQEMFGDPGTNPRKWKIGKIGDLLSEVNYGTSTKANTEGRGLPILRMGNITYGGRIDLSDLKHVELEPREVEKYTTKRGDILFNRTNSKELVGKTAVVKQDEPLAIAGYLVRARVNVAGNSDYISAYLNSPHGKATLMGMCKNIVGMANINAKEMQRIEIALPPAELQKRFSARLDALEPLRTIMENSATESASLFTALQHRAFRGEL